MRAKITLLLLLLGASLQSLAQQASITGKVTNQANKGITATLELWAKKKIEYTVTTDANGAYSFTNVKGGQYDIKATAFNYRDEVKKGIKVKANEVLRVDFKLRPKAIITSPTVTAAGSTRSMKEDETSRSYQWSSGNAGMAKSKTLGAGSYAAAPPAAEYYVKPQFYNPSIAEYKKNPENDFMNVKVSPLSTMSVDVDRASYSNVRRFINEGQLPPVDAVRVEEMINYFDYDYAQPRGEDPIAIQTELTDCPWQKEHKLLHIGMQAKKVKTDNLPPSNLVFLIDVSGSMESDERLPLLVAGMKLLVENLRHSDKVSIVTYAGNAGLVLPPTSGDRKQVILDALDKLEAGGSTAGGEGIELAYKVAQENFIKGGNNRVLLATDGDFNVGVSSDNELENLIVTKRKSGVFLTCLGFGTDNLKDAKMEMLADKGNGNYSYIDNILEAQKALVNEFGGTLFTIAKDVKAQIEFNPAKVQGYRLVGYENRLLNTEDFKDDKKDAGDMGSGHTVTVIYELIPVGVFSKYMRDANDLRYQQPEKTPATYTDELATVKFRYKQPDGGKSKEMVHPIADRTIRWESATENTRFSETVAMFGMLLKGSQYKGSSNYNEVIDMAEGCKTFDKEGYRAEFVRLVKAAKVIDHRLSSK